MPNANFRYPLGPRNSSCLEVSDCLHISDKCFQSCTRDSLAHQIVMHTCWDAFDCSDSEKYPSWPDQLTLSSFLFTLVFFPNPDPPAMAHLQAIPSSSSYSTFREHACVHLLSHVNAGRSQCGFFSLRARISFSGPSD